MASPAGGSGAAAFSDGRDVDNGMETDSGSSHIGSDQPDRSPRPCRWRTSDFHDQECSRYFDCPTHIVERRLSADEALSQHSDSNADSTTAIIQRSDEEISLEGSSGEASIPQVEPPQTQQAEGDEFPDEPAPEAPQQGTDVSLPSSRSESSAASIHASFTPQRIEGVGSSPELHSYPVLSSTGNSEPEIEAQESATETEPEPEAMPALSENRPSLSARGREGSLPHPPQDMESGTDAARISVSEREGGRRRLPEFVVPRWQPDAEVTYCPICHSQFNIFVRKHHCRKCGRVVCNSCSPHRIIIPHQYIVRPPGFEIPLSASLLVDGLGAGYFGVNGPSGGERVRLCNPCVPDPNIAPPQSPSASMGPSPRPLPRDRSSIGNAYGTATQTNRYGTVFASGPGSDLYRGYPHQSSRSRSITMAHGAHQAGVSTAGRRSSAFYQPPLERILAAGSSSSASSYPSRYGALGDSASSSRFSPQIAEEDECPICHRELPDRNLPDSEALRESHINLCIQTHSTYGSPRNGGEGNTPPAAPRRTGMYTYPATEKDCIDDAECTICLEEFTVGVSMARLECLCRFHRSCISAWFINHPGRCPVHQHDGFGY